MTTVQRTLSRVLSQTTSRYRSTSAAVTTPSNEPTSQAASWDSGKPYVEIPGPKPLPVIGNVWRFVPGIGDLANLQFDQLFTVLLKKYGPICKLGGMPGRPDMLLVNDADAAQIIYRSEGTWPTRRGAYVLDHYFRDVRKNLLVSLATAEWQDFRTSVNQVMMQPRHTVRYVEPVDKMSQEFIDRIKAVRYANGQMPPDFANELGTWTLESVCYIALDTRIGIFGTPTPPPEALTMFEAVQGVFDGIYDLDIKPSLWKFVSTPAYRRFIHNMNTFTNVASKYVNKAMERLQHTPKEDLHTQQRSVLENLLLQTDDPNKAVAMALDMLLAGVDTTSAVITTILYQLSLHPEKQAQLQLELDRVIPDKTKPITKEQLEQLRYMRACIKESMRIMPILGSNFRDTGGDVVLAGYQVPKGTVTAFPLKEMFLNEKYFPRAKEFLPERWLPENKDLKTSHPFAFTPFGFGPRMCVGKRFATLEMELLTAKIFRNFSVEWNQPPAKTEFKIVLKFVSPLQFTVKDRV
ncbi:Cytochrome P450 [Frankliniella occidentalis]|nr:Cytochrome P450 [Frankliniella occidentalis]